MQTLESITISAPTDGFVLLMLTGNMILFKNGRTMKIGVGTSSSEMLTSMSCGRLDGTSSNRFYEGFSVSHVVAVKAGSNTFYALAEGSPIFNLGIANVATSSFIGVFIPKRY
jgi:hypothetical protein